MHIICKKQMLVEKINLASKGAVSRTTMPILECLLIKTYSENEEKGITITSNDLEMGIEVKLDEIEIIEEGAIAPDARMFAEIVKKLDGGEVSVESKDSQVIIIKCGKSEFKIMGKPPADFPVLPVVERSNPYSIKCHVLRSMIKNTIFAVSVDESKPVLTGELFEVNENMLTVVAVDGYRAAYRREVLESCAGDFKAVIPSKTLQEISRVIPSNQEESIDFYFTGRHCLFEINGTTLVSRLIEGEFLKYAQVFTDEYKTMVTLRRDELVSSLERAVLIAKDAKKNPVKLNISDDLIKISSMTEIGASYDEVISETEGEELEIGFNPRYLLDCLKAFDDEFAYMKFMGSLSPCQIYGKEPEKCRYLVLPLRLKS